MEQALAELAGCLRSPTVSKQRLALAAPVVRGAETIGVASVRLPIEKLSGGIEGARVPEITYLALRQGSTSLVERGDKALANGAEVMAAKVPGSELRVAAAVPDVPGGPFGLGWLPCAIATALLALGAVVAWLYPVLTRGRGRRAATMTAQAGELARARPGAGRAKPVRQSDAQATSVVIDRGIFRATTCAAVSGKTLDAASPSCWATRSVRMQQQGLLAAVVVGRDAAVRTELTEADQRPAQGRPQRHRYRHGADAGGVLRRYHCARVPACR
jgi:phosphomannomutase/phosphoglucomutase